MPRRAPITGSIPACLNWNEVTIQKGSVPVKQSAALLLATLVLAGFGFGPMLLELADSKTSRLDSVTEILLSDEGIQTDGETDAVYTSHDILYYEDRETYDSGNPYGAGTGSQRHTAQEAGMHTVVNITKPGTYRVKGKLSRGQLRVDLGRAAYWDKNAVVKLILQDVDITCTVAPAILFLNVYECDNNWSPRTARLDVDTAAAGANLILEGHSTVNGSHVAKIYKDRNTEKKLWKQDGAIYSYMSMNVFGPGALELHADNEGIGTELHLSIYGGNIRIYADDDGINASEDWVSLVNILGGDVTIFSGLAEGGDGIDCNGYLVISGGNLYAAANPLTDAGIDSEGTFVHGGTVVALGTPPDWAAKRSKQPVMNLHFGSLLQPGSLVTVREEDGTEVFSFTVESTSPESFRALILSHPDFQQGQTYHIFVDGQQMAYTSTDLWEEVTLGEDGRLYGEQPEQPDFFLQNRVNDFSGVILAQ